MKRKRREKRKEKVKKEVVDEPWNNSEFNRNRTFWHQNKKKESQKKCQKKKKPKENQKKIGLVVLLALFFGKPDGHAVA